MKAYIETFGWPSIQVLQYIKISLFLTDWSQGGEVISLS